MTVLVTGGAGYIGSHCSLALLDAGYDVVLFDNYTTGHEEIIEILKTISFKGKIIDSIKGDLLKREDIDRVFELYNINAVVHFAAFSQVAESMRDPGKYYRNNVCGTLNLLDSMRFHDVNKIVFSSTAATYGEPEYTPIDENHPQKPINPYGKSKLMIEQIMDDYDSAYNIRSVRLRYFNVAGADSLGRIGEWHDPETHLIPNILKSVLGKDQIFSMYGTDYPTRDGTCIRDYINVEDLVSAHISALNYLEKDGNTDFFNLGTNNGSSVKEVFNSCQKITGKEIPIQICERRPGDPAVLIADNAKSKQILKWEPFKTLEDSVKSAFEWEMKKNHRE